MSKEFTPIAIFVYNRYDKFIATLQSLYENIENDIPIFFFIDGPKNSKDKIIIENIFNTISNNDYFNNKRIFKNKKNLGLKQNIINGVNKVFLDYDKNTLAE